MKQSYLPLKIKSVLIYWMMKTLQYHVSIIQYKLYQPVIKSQQKLNQICGSQLSIGNIINRLTARVLDISNVLQNTNVRINDRVCVSSPPFYLDLFERSYPNITLDIDGSPFCIQCMNGIQVTTLAVRQRKRLLDAVVTINKYKKVIEDDDIHIEVFSTVTVSYIKFLLMMLSTLLIKRNHFLEQQDFLKNNLR